MLNAIAPRGWAFAYFARDLEEGAALIDRALLLNSNLAEAWSFGGWVKLWLGEPEAAPPASPPLNLIGLMSP
jgi:hypothetical protein